MPLVWHPLEPPSCGSVPVPVLCRIQVPAELICLDPRALAEVDVISLEQAKKERAERLVWSGPLTRMSRPHRVLRSAAPCLGGCRFHSRPLPQGYDPDATAPFQPKPKQKGRSSTASLVKRKRKVMDQEHRVSGRGGQAGHPEGSALLLAPPACRFSPVSPHPGQSPPEPGAAAAEAREGQAHWGPAVSPGQIRALSLAPRGLGATFCPHTHLWGMTRPWNEEGAGSPLPPGVDSWFLEWGWSVLKRNVDFWITCLHHPRNPSPAHTQPGAALGRGGVSPLCPRPRLAVALSGSLRPSSRERCAPSPTSPEVAFPTSRLW